MAKKEVVTIREHGTGKVISGEDKGSRYDPFDVVEAVFGLPPREKTTTIERDGQEYKGRKL